MSDTNSPRCSLKGDGGDFIPRDGLEDGGVVSPREIRENSKGLAQAFSPSEADRIARQEARELRKKYGE